MASTIPASSDQCQLVNKYNQMLGNGAKPGSANYVIKL